VKTSWTIGFALLVAAACVGCSSAPVMSPTPSPAVETATHALDVTATVEGETFSNPVLDRDFPDPDVLNVDGTYYAFATNSGSSNIQAAESTDLVHWTMLPDALPQLPAWAVQDFGWAGGGYRRMYLAPLLWNDETPVLGLDKRDPVLMP
jgi:arabinan endo-1,5-alpha-L-arabinosidase